MAPLNDEHKVVPWLLNSVPFFEPRMRRGNDQKRNLFKDTQERRMNIPERELILTYVPIYAR
jgi:hypothetical protein